MTRYRFIRVMVVSVLLTGMAVEPAVGDQESKVGGPVACADVDATQLIVLDPVPFDGTTTPLVREVSVGDVIQIQGTYPISPPFPERACVKVSNRTLSALMVTRTANRVAILGPDPQTSGIGVGYVSGYVRANSPGNSRAQLTAFYPKGKTKQVTVAFRISDRKEAEASGTVKVFLYPYELTPRDSLKDGPGDDGMAFPIRSNTMLVWGDLLPEAKFAHPTLHVLISKTGTGNFTVPITVPPGRNGFQPELNLVYSTGTGNGPFGLGWALSIPGISRKTSQGIPRYDDETDVFVLAGAEDLVPVAEHDGVTYYRPRTEGLFARIERHDLAAGHRFWKVLSKDGLVSEYGAEQFEQPSSATTIAKPTQPSQVFSWKLTRTTDPFGNVIEYEYQRDLQTEDTHRWDQLYLKRVRYVDYTRGSGGPPGGPGWRWSHRRRPLGKPAGVLFQRPRGRLG